MRHRFQVPPKVSPPPAGVAVDGSLVLYKGQVNPLPLASNQQLSCIEGAVWVKYSILINSRGPII